MKKKGVCGGGCMEADNEYLILTCGLKSTAFGRILDIANCKSSVAFTFEIFDDLRLSCGCICFKLVPTRNIQIIKTQIKKKLTDNFQFFK